MILYFEEKNLYDELRDWNEQIKESALDKKYVAQDMTCNGLSVAAFVDQYGKNGDSIKKYLNIQQQQIASVVHAK